jgi:hypothetical protein
MQSGVWLHTIAPHLDNVTDELYRNHLSPSGYPEMGRTSALLAA